MIACWWCGVEPTGLVDITTLGDPAPRYLPTWPAETDHVHEADPPSPGELLARGARASDRAFKEWTR